MRRTSLLRSAALAALAALGTLAVPAQAQDGGRDEARAAAREARMQARQERRAANPQRAERAEYRVQAGGESRAQRSPEAGGDSSWQARAERRQAQRTADGEPGWGAGRSGPSRIGRDAAPSGAVRAWRGERGGDWSARNRAGDEGRVGTYPDVERARARADRIDRRQAPGVARERYRDGAVYSSDRYRNANRYGRNDSGWSRDTWRSDRRYDWSNYRNSNRQVFSIGRYYAPYRGYSYSRVGIGFVLDDLFYGNRYWVSDPWQYRLPEVHGPYRWVRYYDDVLLVDIYSGEVVDAIHDFFR